MKPEASSLASRCPSSLTALLSILLSPSPSSSRPPVLSSDPDPDSTTDDHLNILSFWSLFDVIANWRAQRSAGSSEDGIIDQTSTPPLLSRAAKAIPMLRAWLATLEAARSRCRCFIEGPGILSGQWRGPPKLMALLLFLLHLAQVTLCVEIGFKHCDALTQQRETLLLHGSTEAAAEAEVHGGTSGSLPEDRFYCGMLCDHSGAFFLVAHCIEIGAKWFCSSRFVSVPAHQRTPCLLSSLHSLSPLPPSPAPFFR